MAKKYNLNIIYSTMGLAKRFGTFAVRVEDLGFDETSEHADRIPEMVERALSARGQDFSRPYVLNIESRAKTAIRRAIPDDVEQRIIDYVRIRNKVAESVVNSSVQSA